MHVYVEIDVLGRYICVYERVCMDLDYMAWYISFPQYVLQILVVTTLEMGMVFLVSWYPLTPSVPTHPRDHRKHIGTQQGARSAFIHSY